MSLFVCSQYIISLMKNPSIDPRASHSPLLERGVVSGGGVCMISVVLCSGLPPTALHS